MPTKIFDDIGNGPLLYAVLISDVI